MAADAVHPTGEVLSNVSVSRSAAGVISFSFTKAQEGVPTLVPTQRMPGTEDVCATPCFPVATLDATGTSFVAALFPSWAMDNPTDQPSPHDKHFAHSGLWWSNTPKWLTVDLHNGRVLNQAMIAAASAGRGGAESTNVLSSTDWAPAMNGGSSSSSSDRAAGGMGGMGGMGTRAGGGSGMAMDSSMPMHSVFYAPTTSGGSRRHRVSLMFDGASLDSPANLAGGVLLTICWAAMATAVPAFSAAVERRGAKRGQPRWTAAAGSVATLMRFCFHYGAMLLVMSFNGESPLCGRRKRLKVSLSSCAHAQPGLSSAFWAATGSAT